MSARLAHEFFPGSNRTSPLGQWNGFQMRFVLQPDYQQIVQIMLGLSRPPTHRECFQYFGEHDSKVFAQYRWGDVWPLPDGVFSE